MVWAAGGCCNPARGYCDLRKPRAASAAASVCSSLSDDTRSRDWCVAYTQDRGGVCAVAAQRGGRNGGIEGAYL